LLFYTSIYYSIIGSRLVTPLVVGVHMGTMILGVDNDEHHRYTASVRCVVLTVAKSVPSGERARSAMNVRTAARRNVWQRVEDTQAVEAPEPHALKEAPLPFVDSEAAEAEVLYKPQE
jgi:hypothetical protein